jgi:Putative porin
MNHKLRSAALSAVVLAAAGASPVMQADEVSELKAAVQALQKRLDQLETRAKAVDDTNDRQTDQIAQAKASTGSWVSNFTFKGDFRYRNETIDQEFVQQRNRDRVRARFGFTAKINDSLKTEFQMSTSENNDPRSSNVTLTGVNTRKLINFDLAYVEWQALTDWRLTAGKMRQPWYRPGQSVLIDGDINPEGIAANYAHGDVFASAFYNSLVERAADNDSAMFGGQVGWRPSIGVSRLTLGVGYYDYQNVKARNPFFEGPNGNTVRTGAANCKGGVATCLAFDYDELQLFGEWSTPVAGRPLAVFADVYQNLEADNGLDTAWSAGVTYGKASDPRTWEIGYMYQVVEKDGVFGQYVDSDFGGGNTDARGNVVKLGYAPARNWVVNAWYHWGQTNNDASVLIPGIGQVFDRDYERLQIDLNFKF